MKPKVDSNLSTKRVKGKSKRKLLNIPKECKRVKMNDKCYLGVLEEKLYEWWRRATDKSKFYHNKGNLRRKFKLGKKEVLTFCSSPYSILKWAISSRCKIIASSSSKSDSYD